MDRLLYIGLLFLLIMLPGDVHTDQFIEDLTLNYSDFMYVSAIAVGFRYAYFGTTNGITRYNISDQRWGEPLTGIEGPRGTSINRIEVSFDDRILWVSTDQGYFEYNEVFNDWEQLQQWPDIINRNQHLSPDRQFIPPPGYNYMPDGSLVDNRGRVFQLTDIVKDDWFNLWIGTWGLGAARSDQHHNRIELMNYGLLQEDITTLYWDDGQLWMGGLTYDAVRTGITIFDPEANGFDYIETFGSFIGRPASILDITGNSENVFVGTDNGVTIIDKETQTTVDRLGSFRDIPGNYVSCMTAVDDVLYAGTEQGLAIVAINGDTADYKTKTILAKRAIEALCLAGDFLWIGTDRGAYRFNLGTRVLGRLKATEITQSGYIHDIAIDGKRVWLATEDELASIDMETAAIELYPEVNNYGRVHAIAVQDTIVAAAVGQGLLLIYTGVKPHHELFTTTDGLLSNQIRDLLFKGDYLWLGTDRGLTRFWYKNPAIM